jgi:tRNA A-37 threonylcarbamoyl transferase component Bud32
MNPIHPDHLIGRGAQADVYLYDSQVIKLFHEGVSEEAVLYEADIQQRVFNAGLSAPQVYGVATMEGRYAILMEHMPGPSLGELMERDRPRAREYLKQAVALQVQMHRTPGNGLPSQREKLRRRISSVSALQEDAKQRLLQLLDTLAADETVCHGDFHPYNIIQTEKGLAVIDWVDASCGSALADACRSYLLYLLHGKEAAEAYLHFYCEQSDVSKDEVLKWLPILAGARLCEAGRGDDVELLLRLAGASPLHPTKGSVAPIPPVADWRGQEEAGETSNANGSEQCDD